MVEGSNGQKPPTRPPTEFTPAGGPGDDPLTRTLKRVYEDIASEPVPSEWLSLLEELDARSDNGAAIGGPDEPR